MRQALGRLSRIGSGTQATILLSFAAGQGLVMLTSLARIPLIVSSIGAVGYGLLLAITSVGPWLLLAVNGLTSVARVDIAESLGSDQLGRAVRVLEALLHRARRMALFLVVISLLAAFIVPWSALLGKDHLDLAWYELPLAVVVSGVLVASATTGSVYQGLLQADRRVAITSVLPGVAAVLGLLITAAAALWSAPFVVFVIGAGVATSAPFWIAQLLGRRQLAILREKARAGAADHAPRYRSVRFGDLAVMTGAGAPPLFSTGWDPLILGAATGPADVAAYGLASRLALLVTVGPSALYPHYWSEYARLRAAGDNRALSQRLRRDILRLGVLTTALGVVFVAIGPIAGGFLGSGSIDRPRSLYLAMAVLGVLSALQTVMLPILGGRRTARRVATLVFASVVPNVVLSFLLSRLLGPSGPVVASIVFSLLLLAMAVWMIRRELAPTSSSWGAAAQITSGARRRS